MRRPQINAAEWKAISAALPAHRAAGRPRQDDRAYVSAFAYAEACQCSLASLPAGYPNPVSLETRRRRWQQAGVWDRVMAAAVPAIVRMRRKYWGLLHDASDVSSPDWRHSSEFFGRGVIPRLPRSEPRGRYSYRSK